MRSESFAALTDRLKYCSAVMHAHRFIHRDIKPANIVWSRSANDYVFCDFGVSCIVLEEFGFKTLAYSEGTEFYMTA
jgi:serine/threonine protein kinase